MNKKMTVTRSTQKCKKRITVLVCGIKWQHVVVSVKIRVLTDRGANMLLFGQCLYVYRRKVLA